MTDLKEKLRTSNLLSQRNQRALQNESADRIEKLEAALREAGHDGWERGMREAANICAMLAETTYDDADAFDAATGCEAAIVGDIRIHQQSRATLKNPIDTPRG